MPVMFSPARAVTVTTTAGHTIHFPKGAPVAVPDDLKVIDACRAVGVLYQEQREADAAAEAQTTTLAASNIPVTPEARQARLVALLTEMAEHSSAHRDHFTAFGRPNSRYVARTLGFEVNTKEIESLWGTLTQPPPASAG